MTLRLRENQVSARKAERLIDALMHIETPFALYLDYNQIDNDGKRYIKNALQRNSRIKITL